MKISGCQFMGIFFKFIENLDKLVMLFKIEKVFRKLIVLN